MLIVDDLAAATSGFARWSFDVQQCSSAVPTPIGTSTNTSQPATDLPYQNTDIKQFMPSMSKLLLL
jgi:hypothetical protein